MFQTTNQVYKWEIFVGRESNGACSDQEMRGSHGQFIGELLGPTNDSYLGEHK